MCNNRFLLNVNDHTMSWYNVFNSLLSDSSINYYKMCICKLVGIVWQWIQEQYNVSLTFRIKWWLKCIHRPEWTKWWQNWWIFCVNFFFVAELYWHMACLCYNVYWCLSPWNLFNDKNTKYTVLSLIEAQCAKAMV